MAAAYDRALILGSCIIQPDHLIFSLYYYTVSTIPLSLNPQTHRIPNTEYRPPQKLPPTSATYASYSPPLPQILGKSNPNLALPVPSFDLQSSPKRTSLGLNASVNGQNQMQDLGRISRKSRRSPSEGVEIYVNGATTSVGAIGETHLVVKRLLSAQPVFEVVDV